MSKLLLPIITGFTGKASFPPTLSSHNNRVVVVLFADDTSLIFRVNRNNAKTGELVINNTLNKVCEWFSANNLMLNSKKTKCIKCSPPNTRCYDLEVNIGGNSLELVKDSVFLGIHIDSRLQWGSLIKSLSGKLSSAAYAIKKIRQLTDIPTARLDFAYFHSLMSYAVILWGSAADLESIFILQKRAIRNIYKMKTRESLRELFFCSVWFVVGLLSPPG